MMRTCDADFSLEMVQVSLIFHRVVGVHLLGSGDSEDIPRGMMIADTNQREEKQQPEHYLHCTRVTNQVAYFLLLDAPQLNTRK